MFKRTSNALLSCRVQPSFGVAFYFKFFKHWKAYNANLNPLVPAFLDGSAMYL